MPVIGSSSTGRLGISIVIDELPNVVACEVVKSSDGVDYYLSAVDLETNRKLVNSHFHSYDSKVPGDCYTNLHHGDFRLSTIGACIVKSGSALAAVLTKTKSIISARAGRPINEAAGQAYGVACVNYMPGLVSKTRDEQYSSPPKEKPAAK